MTRNTIEFDENGAVAIGDVVFKPVSSEDADILAGPGVGVGLREVQLDVFNSDSKNPRFFGYLDIFFNGCGNFAFVEYCEKNGIPYVRMDNRTIEERFGDYRPNRKKTILAIAEYAEYLINRNKRKNPRSLDWMEIAMKLKERTPEKVRLTL